ncbi:hypothetical protein H4219_003450 [Mycoemilia scoparia]|uniref:NudC domain-containing protein 1 n=1 Tax=Mycoemilia scoparia TaxID=417184 RepID=A0A9W7ZUV6_9FUNG|nr:hypothetical protein H4219_003450 [Mycoemilia scoparia]
MNRAPQTISIKQDPKHRNPNFEGYKLRLVPQEERLHVSQLPHPSIASSEKKKIPTNAYMSYQELHHRVQFNHLFSGPRPGTLLFVANNNSNNTESRQMVMMAILQPDSDIKYESVFDIPASPSLLNRETTLYGYPFIKYLGNSLVLVFDGIETVYLCQEQRDQGNGQWGVRRRLSLAHLGESNSVVPTTATDNKDSSQEDSSSSSSIMYMILAADICEYQLRLIVTHRAEEITTTKPLGSLRSPSKDRNKFITRVIAAPIISLNLNLGQATGSSHEGNRIEHFQCLQTLQSSTIPVYTEFMPGNQGRNYILGCESKLQPVYNNVNEQQQEQQQQQLASGVSTSPSSSPSSFPVNVLATEPKSHPYYWQQTDEDVTVCIPIPHPDLVTTSQIQCTMTKFALTLKLAPGSQEKIISFDHTAFYDHIDPANSLWTLEDNKSLLTLHLQKSRRKFRWLQVFDNNSDVNSKYGDVEETMDPSEFALIREQLAKLTMPICGNNSQSPLQGLSSSRDIGSGRLYQQGLGSEYDEELDSDNSVAVTFSVWSLAEKKMVASSVPLSNDWICSGFSSSSSSNSSPSPTPNSKNNNDDGAAGDKLGSSWLDLSTVVCLKNDVDGLVYQFSTNTGEEEEDNNHNSPAVLLKARHVCTFGAFSFVKASKRDTRFCFIDPYLQFSLIAESSRRVYLYHRCSPDSPRNSIADQNVVDLPADGSDTVGIQLIGHSRLAILQENKLCVYDI